MPSIRRIAIKNINYQIASLDFLKNEWDKCYAKNCKALSRVNERGYAASSGEFQAIKRMLDSTDAMVKRSQGLLRLVVEFDAASSLGRKHQAKITKIMDGIEATEKLKDYFLDIIREKATYPEEITRQDLARGIASFLCKIEDWRSIGKKYAESLARASKEGSIASKEARSELASRIAETKRLAEIGRATLAHIKETGLEREYRKEIAKIAGGIAEARAKIIYYGDAWGSFKDKN